MNASLQVLSPGAGCTVQDRGRFGHRSIGMPLAGALDPILLACANGLAGAPEDAAAIEIALTGPTVQAQGAPIRVALAGAITAGCQRVDGHEEKIESFASVLLQPGDRLAVGACRAGVAYLATSGGCQVPPMLGSRSTYVRAALGGVQGRALAVGDELPCAAAAKGSAECMAEAWAHDSGPIRVIPGPQIEHFAPAAFETLFGADYEVSRESDRMGMRLIGPLLAHHAERGADIHSEGVVPGSIQVPGNGAPIVLLADAQTVGGYAKIGTVIRADLPRLAHLRPGARIRFAPCSMEEALAARRALAAALARWTGTIRPQRAAPDPELLYRSNLVSGSIDASSGRLPWDD